MEEKWPFRDKRKITNMQGAFTRSWKCEVEFRWEDGSTLLVSCSILNSRSNFFPLSFYSIYWSNTSLVAKSSFCKVDQISSPPGCIEKLPNDSLSISTKVSINPWLGIDCSAGSYTFKGSNFLVCCQRCIMPARYCFKINSASGCSMVSKESATI